MKHLLFAAALLGLVVVPPACANSRIKIDTVPAEYTPYTSEVHEPVSLNGFHFEVNQETGRARLVAVFTYHDNMVAGKDDGGGPRSTVVQLPGLVYDAQSHAVVYSSEQGRTVCAVIQESRGFWGRRSIVKSTGACSVTTEPADLTSDDGWSLHRTKVLNVFLDVH